MISNVLLQAMFCRCTWESGSNYTELELPTLFLRLEEKRFPALSTLSLGGKILHKNNRSLVSIVRFAHMNLSCLFVRKYKVSCSTSSLWSVCRTTKGPLKNMEADVNLSLPMQVSPFCKGWFRGVLPEGVSRVSLQHNFVKQNCKSSLSLNRGRNSGLSMSARNTSTSEHTINDPWLSVQKKDRFMG